MANYGMPYPSDSQQFPQPYQQGYPQQHPQPFTPPSGGQITPGTITYTTSTGADGRVIYHPFKAVPASYQTSGGVVSGIQWVPAEATQILPSGALPANADFAASWNRGYLSQKDQKALKDWQRDEEKRRKKEEKESHRRLREKEYDARERDAQSAVARERRKSFNQGPISPPLAGYPVTSPQNSAGYPVTSPQNSAGYPSGYPYGNYATGGSDLDRRFGGMDIGGRDYDDHKHGGLGRPRKYSVGESDRGRDVYGDRSAYNTGPGFPSARTGQPTPYSNTGSHYAGSSPNMRTPEPRYAATAPGGYPGSSGGDPFARSASPYNGATSSVYPRGHILEGQPMPRSRATTPIPGAHPFPQPGITSPASGPFSEEPQLAAPEGFSRPINAAQPYTPFEMMRVQDMDDFANHIPRMPLVLQPHDVFHEDWIRFMQDLALVWAGRMPVPELSRGGRTPKRATLAADLIDTWNKSFFVARGVEVVLYKGRERRSGANAGTIDRTIPMADGNDSLSSSSTSSSEDNSDLSGDERYGQGGYGGYGRQGHGDSSEARRRRHEKKEDKKRRAKDRKHRRKAKERQQAYGLYLTCVPQGGVGPGYGNALPGHSYSAGGYGGMGPAGGAGGTAGVPLRSISPMPGVGPIGGRVSPMPMPLVGGHHTGSGYGGGRTSPMPPYSGPVGGRTSPMPGYSAGGRTSPMPAYPITGRTSPMPAYPITGRASPMPTYPITGRASPMPAYPITGRASPMPVPYVGGRASPMPGGGGY